MAVIDPVEQSMTVPIYPIWRLSVDQYHRMIEAGILTDDDPVELIEGVLVFHMPKNPPHEYVIHAAQDAIRGLLPSGWLALTQTPVTLADGGLSPISWWCEAFSATSRHDTPALPTPPWRSKYPTRRCNATAA